MAIINTNEVNNVVANCEDEEMVQYKKNSLSVVTFRMVNDEDDLETPHTKQNSFKPDMAHQIFGETEMIFGYKQLSICLYYLHNSARCFVDIRKGEKIVESETCKADDIMKALNPWLPSNYTLEKEKFFKDIDDEDHADYFGRTIFRFEENDRTYRINICDIKEEEFRQFHERFETLIVWFIDGANFIDLDDSRWTIFYVFEEYILPGTNMMWRSPVGFCTVYEFFLYPNLTRPRISQFFILPTHQRRGIGTRLYSAVYEYLRDLPHTGDITVEEPTETFQKIRDFSDSYHMHKALILDELTISIENADAINALMKRHKICKRQARRVFDILECLNAHKNGHNEYVKFTENIKTRITNEVEKETRGSKRLCNSERVAVNTQPMDKKVAVEAEYKRYVDSLEWPTKRLMNFLAQNIRDYF